MAFKLVYTSAPKGLKEGSFGFCTVACSRNLSERTIAALEAFSGYRRLFVDAERAALNPVAYSHVLLDDGETTLRVLSRIADAGLDYSNRNNKIASHLVLGHTELREIGPAAFFSVPDLFAKRWEGAPQIFDKPFILPNLTSNVNSCEEWKKVTGDPGWAGVLASTVYTDRPVVLIVRPEQNVLALYQEALALLPPVMRWQATFSTYYTKTPPGIRCQWKATILGSSESQTTRAIPYVLILDLTSPPAIKPESIDSSPQAFGLIKAARGLASPIRSVVRPSNVTPSTVDVRHNNGDVDEKVGVYDVRSIEKPNVSLSSNLSFATSAKKLLDYGRELPLKNFFNKNLKEQKRWRLIGVVTIGVCALIALVVIGINLANFAGKQAQNLPINEKIAQKTATQDADSDKSKASDLLDASRTDAAESKTNRKVDFSDSSDRREEKTSDPFVFDEEKAPKENKESDDDASSTKKQPDKLASTSKSTEENKEETKEKVDDGIDLNDDLSKYSSSKSARPSSFLSSESYQTVEKFKKSVSNREFAVDFGVFQRKESKNEESLDGELSDESQELFFDVWELCKKYNGNLKITCDLSADQNNERQWASSSQRINKQEIIFSQTESSYTKKIIFETSDSDKKPNGSFSIEIDSQGKLAFHMSDDATRNYFLRSCRLKWAIELPSPNETDKDFVAETDFAQLLKPCDFDLLKGSQYIATAIKLSNDGLLPLAVQNDLSYYDPVRNPKLSPALMAQLNPDAKPSAFNVESQMDEKKKSIVFIFKLKAENIEAFKIRFSRNSQVVRAETVLDKETLTAQLEDFFAKQGYSAFPYSSSSATPQDKLQRALQEIELAQNRKITFDFYLVSTTGKEQYNKSKFIFIGSASVTPSELAQKEK